VSEPDATRAEGTGAGPSHVRVSSREIFRGQREIVILHGDHEYRLRITRADKLILTK
jgi:hemin uptake protein HemP